ncbi:MAG: hypothetical protein IIC82_08115 [Chloroflexi bacterium]|nr:hypothetical protein [Chloroflexota bacterium]
MPSMITTLFFLVVGFFALIIVTLKTLLTPLLRLLTFRHPFHAART